uniref:Aminoglycoside phosphotransferase domain-containing protein n=1 Tax=Romanomermis culicivorax TaxID=13658 RepID=A0A915KII6_ROMCU
MMPDVMLHGDTWINNIMFLKDAKNPALLTEEVAAFFDWQLSVRGCGLNDLARLTLWYGVVENFKILKF